MHFERRRPDKPVEAIDPRYWKADFAVIDSALKQMIEAKKAYVEIEKESDGNLLHKVYRKSDDKLLGFIDRKGLEEWIESTKK